MPAHTLADLVGLFSLSAATPSWSIAVQELRMKGLFNESNVLMVKAALESVGFNPATVAALQKYHDTYLAAAQHQVKVTLAGSFVQGAGYDLGIICTKQHEFDAFRSTLDSNRINHGVVTPVDDWCYFDWTHNGRRIIAASFLDVQGPVECAMRATQLIQMFGLKTIAMVGIAGGKDRLGDVVVAYSAFTPECGRTVRVPADGAPPDSGWKYVPSRDVNRNEGYIESRDNFGLVTQFTSNPPLLNDAGQHYNVLPGPFASYNEVRNDCSVLISHPTLMEYKCTAIEMEAYALIKAASLSKVKVLAVVKGISDVGEERFEGWLAQDQRSGVAVHNWNQLRLVEPALSVLPQDNNDLRKKYRKIAGRRAAQVMLELVRMWAM